MSTISAATLLLSVFFGDLNPQQQKEIDCYAVLTIASTETNSHRKFGIANLRKRMQKYAAVIGPKAMGEMGMSEDDFLGMIADRTMHHLTLAIGGKARIAKLRPKVNACKPVLDQVAAD